MVCSLIKVRVRVCVCARANSRACVVCVLGCVRRVYRNTSLVALVSRVALPSRVVGLLPSAPHAPTTMPTALVILEAS